MAANTTHPSPQVGEGTRHPARIYFKDESVSPAGSHKTNTAVAQAYYNKAEQIKRIASETGAGQWGSAIALACEFFGLECTVYMVAVSYHHKPYRRVLMQTWGGDVIPSPSKLTTAGRAVLKRDPNASGSLGLAISEAVEDAAARDDTHYALGSVLDHVLLHQSVIGLEAQQQLRQAGEDLPDVIIGCCGGSSNLGGLALPFVPVSAGATGGNGPRRSSKCLRSDTISSPRRCTAGVCAITGIRRSFPIW